LIITGEKATGSNCTVIK